MRVCVCVCVRVCMSMCVCVCACVCVRARYLCFPAPPASLCSSDAGDAALCTDSCSCDDGDVSGFREDVTKLSQICTHTHTHTQTHKRTDMDTHAHTHRERERVRDRHRERRTRTSDQLVMSDYESVYLV